jgi:hypothetical protein
VLLQGERYRGKVRLRALLAGAVLRKSTYEYAQEGRLELLSNAWIYLFLSECKFRANSSLRNIPPIPVLFYAKGIGIDQKSVDREHRHLYNRMA